MTDPSETDVIQATSLNISVLDGRLAICRLEADAQPPTWATGSPFLSLTRTPDELSVVCAEGSVPIGVRGEGGWRAIGLEGPLDFSLVGVLSAMLVPLAEAGVVVFAISTHDTDYVLVKEEKLDLAVAALRGRGYTVS